MKQWLRLERPDRLRIADAVEDLRLWPDCRNVKALAGREEFRLRVGRFRVIFSVDLRIVRIEEVKKRDEHTC
jgi:mRNA-degrading endonuclease RelE of RelBE toxin-antitoxin system